MKRLFYFLILILSSQIVVGQTIKRNKHYANDSIYVDFINPFYAPIELRLFPLDSSRAYIKVKSYGLLKYNDTLKNALIIPINKIRDTANIKTSALIKFKGTFGDPNTVVDEDYKYTLPYPKNKRYKIIQSFGGKFSHNKPHSKYALDIGTQIGDTITASRGGKVFYVKEDSNEHCRTIKCIDKGNKVLILHEDGTMAHYVHLNQNGVLVEIGDTVEVGQPIAISGMTGFTTIPHLHLVIYKSNSISIPFYFKGQKTKKLKKGKYYRRTQ